MTITDTVTTNVRNWRKEKGFTAREREVARISAQREAQERADALNNAHRAQRLARVLSMGGKIPPGAVDARFRCGKDGRGGRVHWQFTFAPAI